MMPGRFFLSLQNKLKNMNFMAFEGEEYRKAWSEIEQMLAAI